MLIEPLLIVKYEQLKSLTTDEKINNEWYIKMSIILS